MLPGKRRGRLPGASSNSAPGATRRGHSGERVPRRRHGRPFVLPPRARDHRDSAKSSPKPGRRLRYPARRLHRPQPKPIVEATFFAFCSRAAVRAEKREKVPWRAPQHHSPSFLIRPTRNTRVTTLFGRAAASWVSIASLVNNAPRGRFVSF